MGEISTTQTSTLVLGGKTFTLKTTLSADDSGVPGGNDPGLPNDGKQSKPGANPDARTWKAVKMRKDPKLWKVVDNKNVNVYEEFHSQATAQQYIDHFLFIQGGGPITPPPTPTPQPTTLKAIINVLPSTTISIGQPFILDGAKSQGNIEKYEWSQTSGQTTQILIPTARNTTVVLPQDIQEGQLVYQLIITGSDGKTDTASVTVTVSFFIPPTPPIPDDKDPEGIAKLYPDDPDPVKAKQAWFLSEKGPNDSRVSGKGARKIIPGTNIVQITPDPGTNPASARFYVSTTNPKALDTNAQLENGKDWAKMAQLKYMVGPEDFRNCEVTHYYKITKSSASDEMTTYWMGGAHPSGDAFPLQCIACCNKAQIKMDMTPRAAKEYHHAFSPAGYAWNPTKALFDLKSALGGTMVGKMIGQKLVMYCIDNPDGTPKEVHLKLFVDTQSKDLPKPDYTKQKWDLLAEWVDNGSNWPDPSNDMYIKNCNAKKGQMISWGGPYIALRLDDNIWELHALSIRPILAPSQ